MTIEGGPKYIADRANDMMEIEIDHPHVMTNSAMVEMIDRMEAHDPALWSVFKVLVKDVDRETDLGLRLRAKEYIPMLNEVLTKMRTDGINMDWVTIQLQIALMADEKGAQSRVAHNNSQYEWSVMGKTIPSRIIRGLRMDKDLYQENIDFSEIV